jgi:hypothetical protein
MRPEQDYTAANLSQDLIDDLKSFETKLRDEANKDVIIIAYEKET